MLNETNQFASKQLLSSTDQESNYLVYNPLIDDPEHDWFLDIKLYSEEYRADQISRWMQDMKIANVQELRKEIKQYKGFFEVILSKLMHYIIYQNISTDIIMSTVKKRRTSAWYENYSYFY